MKGTPFYSGEYEERHGPAEDRVNLWPLVYYRPPALSVLWPIGELSDQHAAVRPVFSVYGLDKDEQVYGVFWPLIELNMQTDRHRVFPFLFWGNPGGEDYRVVFPLYWHFDDPYFGAGGTDALFPLWIYDRGGEALNAWLMWPLLHWKQAGPAGGWRLWPLVGNYWGEERSYRYALWPLAHQWSRENGRTRGETVIPLFYRERTGNGGLFLSVPWSSGTYGNGDFWRLAPPLFYASREGARRTVLTPLWWGGWSDDDRSSWHVTLPMYYYGSAGETRTFATLLGGFTAAPAETSWVAVPVLGAGSFGAGHAEAWVLGPLAHWASRGEATQHHVLPFYLYERRPKQWRFLSVPWSCGGGPGDRSWQLVPPLVYHARTERGEHVVTPVWSQGRNADGSAWWQCLVPLYFRRSTPEERLFATLAGGWHTDAGGQRWLIYPLLSGGRWGEGAGSFWAPAPLIHAEWWPGGSSHHVLPFYLWDGRARTFLSPLMAQWRGADGGRTTLVPPLLSWLIAGERQSDLWLLGPMAHAAWGDGVSQQHVFPLFWRDGAAGQFFSLPWAQWRNAAGGTTYAVPPALSRLSTGPDRSDLWLLGPLVHGSWGKKAGPHHVLPLYYRNTRTGTFVSPLFATWRSGARRHHFVPPLLSNYAAERDQRELLAALGLFHQAWGAEPSRGHLAPLYVYRGDEWFYTPLFGWNNKPAGWMYPLTPLLGVRKGTHSGGWLWPLVNYRRNRETGNCRASFLLWGRHRRRGARTQSYFFPLYGVDRFAPTEVPEGAEHPPHELSVLCFPGFWYESKSEVAETVHHEPHWLHVKKHGLFPLWSYKRRERPQKGRLRVRSRLLGHLYDHSRHVNPAAPDVKDRRRTRVLWRLWHYENHDGDVGLDVFPAFAYTAKTDGYLKWQFLWRVLGYESDPGEGKELSVLFVPIRWGGVVAGGSS
jgi:hypothetical protein